LYSYLSLEEKGSDENDLEEGIDSIKFEPKSFSAKEAQAGLNNVWYGTKS
jgi:hypothetical protein